MAMLMLTMLMVTILTMTISMRITTMTIIITGTVVITATISRVIWIGPHKILALIYTENFSIINKCIHYLGKLPMKARVRLHLFRSPTIKGRTIEI